MERTAPVCGSPKLARALREGKNPKERREAVVQVPTFGTAVDALVDGMARRLCAVNACETEFGFSRTEDFWII